MEDRCWIKSVLGFPMLQQLPKAKKDRNCTCRDKIPQHPKWAPLHFPGDRINLGQNVIGTSIGSHAQMSQRKRASWHSGWQFLRYAGDVFLKLYQIFFHKKSSIERVRAYFRDFFSSLDGRKGFETEAPRVSNNDLSWIDGRFASVSKHDARQSHGNFQLWRNTRLT